MKYYIFIVDPVRFSRGPNDEVAARSASHIFCLQFARSFHTENLKYG